MGIPDYLSRFASAAVTPLEATEIAGWFAHPWKRSWDLEKMTFLTIPTFPVLPQQQITVEFLLQLQRQDPILEAIREAVFDQGLWRRRKESCWPSTTRPAAWNSRLDTCPTTGRALILTRFEIERRRTVISAGDQGRYRRAIFAAGSASTDASSLSWWKNTTATTAAIRVAKGHSRSFGQSTGGPTWRQKWHFL